MPYFLKKHAHYGKEVVGLLVVEGECAQCLFFILLITVLHTHVHAHAHTNTHTQAEHMLYTSTLHTGLAAAEHTLYTNTTHRLNTCSTHQHYTQAEHMLYQPTLHTG